MAAPVTHFEIHAEAPAKLAAFHRSLLGTRNVKVSNEILSSGIVGLGGNLAD
jgi:hypothetical protein